MMAASLLANWSAAGLAGGRQTGEIAFEYVMGGSIDKTAMSKNYKQNKTSNKNAWKYIFSYTV